MYPKIRLLLALLLGVTMSVVAAPHPASAVSRPSVTRLSVASGPTAGGTRVTIRGKHLTQVVRVLFGNARGTRVVVRSAGSLTVTAPAHAVGVVHVRVVTRHGTSKAVRADRFRYADWVRTALPRPSDAAFAPRISQSACWADRHCVATGTYRQRSGNDAAVLWTLSGVHWSGTRAPVPDGAATNPHPVPLRISCGAAGVCAAYAVYQAHRDGRDEDAALLWALTPGGWTATAPPVPADADAGTGAHVTDVSCAGSVCAARGAYELGGNLRPAFWTSDHGVWSVAIAPLPSNAVRVDLGSVVDVACGGATCAAGGVYLADPGLSSRRALWARTGAAWMVSEAPAPAGLSYAPTDHIGAACGPAVCLATFDLTRGSGLASAVWTLAGGSWTATSIPLPPGAASGTGYISATTCAATGTCVAVGQYEDAAGDAEGALWVRSAGGAWTVSRATLPADAAQNPRVTIRRVVCADNGTCVAVGAYVYHQQGSDIDQESQYDSLQWTYADGRWTLLRRYGFNRDVDAQPSTVSCASDYCVRFDGAQTVWAGRSWRTYSPHEALGGLSNRGGVALAAFSAAAWVYVG
ncbi:IPT/TIG domain-containing protein [Nocardioides conyzicola]|uniref:IPT/TIG domain-containing protein n=1 Tax=Nocardioides conyzicola TaxID=1651781 RepID=A0ABP8XBP5_9ACTN